MPNAGVSAPSLPGVPGQVPAAQLLRSASPAAWMPLPPIKQLCPKRALKSLPASPAACQPTCRPVCLPGQMPRLKALLSGMMAIASQHGDLGH
ncbi:TPA: hypothetical protein ACH3X3_011510 [Trebouxia sp. C0006]